MSNYTEGIRWAVGEGFFYSLNVRLTGPSRLAGEVFSDRRERLVAPWFGEMVLRICCSRDFTMSLSCFSSSLISLTCHEQH